MSSKYKTAIDRITDIINKKGVTIKLDYDETTILAKMGSMYSYEPKSKVLEIVVPKLGVENKKLLLRIIRKVVNDGGLIWKDTKIDELNSYNDYTATRDDKKTLNFFSGILNRDDYFALKMSLYLRDQSIKGKSIGSYKMDIRTRFGERGANIANLCSSGYFEDEFMPLFISKEISQKEAYDYYEMVVGAKARALFVYSQMTVSEIEEQVEKMVDKAIKYHMNDFRIHGKGDINVGNIKEFVNARTGKERYKISTVYDVAKIKAVEYTIEIKR